MHIVLLSGGSGKRLWPLSSDKRPKQFLEILKSPEGKLESMVQRVYRQIRETGITDSVTIATGVTQLELIREQLGDDVEVVEEPSRRDTFPAIVLSCAYLAYEKNVSRDEVVAVLPIDPYCELYYFLVVKQMEATAQKGFADIVLMGIDPREPSEKFGYIVPKRKIVGYSPTHVERFVEKPATTTAEALINDGALWNGGVFCFKLGYLLDMVAEQFAVYSYDDALKNYDKLTKTSFDYAVVEKAASVGVVKYSGFWEDLGTWGALSEQIEEQAIGNVIMGEGASNTHIINKLNIPVVALGVTDLVIVASEEGILVTKKSDSGSLKSYVDKVG